MDLISYLQHRYHIQLWAHWRFSNNGRRTLEQAEDDQISKLVSEEECWRCWAHFQWPSMSINLWVPWLGQRHVDCLRLGSGQDARRKRSGVVLAGGTSSRMISGARKVSGTSKCWPHCLQYSAILHHCRTPVHRFQRLGLRQCHQSFQTRSS